MKNPVRSERQRPSLHILEGLRIALDNIDEIIKTVRSAYDNAQEKLMERFGLSEIQAQTILDVRLARLQGLEREKIDKEYAELMEKNRLLQPLLADEKLLMGVIKDELLRSRRSTAISGEPRWLPM